MSQNKPNNKSGFTVQELEHIAKKYRFEVFFCAAFVLSALFSKIFNVAGFSILLTAIGGVVGMVFPSKTQAIIGQMLEFTCKQERVTQIVIGVVLIILSIVIAPVIFLLIGAICGKAIHQDTIQCKSRYSQNSDHNDRNQH
jgi:hypothetical protein